MPRSSRLVQHTRLVLANCRREMLEAAQLPPRPDQPPRPVPERTGEHSLFEHVIYIIKDNRTYDQILGDLPEGNGDASLGVFGEAVTPNQHKLAREFVLLDNTCGKTKTSPRATGPQSPAFPPATFFYSTAKL